MNTIRITPIRIGVAALACLAIGSGEASAQSSGPLVIVGAQYRSATETIENITIVMQKGKIKAMGRSVALPANATVVDGKNKVVTAGLIATNTRLGMVEVGAVGYTNEGQFGAGIHAAYQIKDGYNPASMVIAVARNGGVTSTLSAPGGGLVAGQSAWFTLGEGSTEQNLVKNSTAMLVNLGRHSRGAGDGSRGLALQHLRSLFDDAAHYAKNRAAYNRGQTRKYGAGHLDLEALSLVLSRKIPMVVRVDRKSDIAAVLRFAKALNIRLVLQGATEAWMLAEELSKAKVAVILNPKANLPSSFDDIHVVDNAAARLASAGVTIIISPYGDSFKVRTLRQLAGLAVAHGLTWSQAFAAITTAPAAVFSVKRGTLKVGAAADLVLWSGDPLELSTRPEQIIIGGVQQSKNNHQTALLKRYRKL